MFNKKTIMIGMLLLILLFSSTAPKAETKKNIILLATGGTIAGQSINKTNIGYQAGTLGVNALIQAIPDLKSIATISGEQFVNISSQDMSPEIWLKLAKRVNTILANPKIDGIVITHGTDTLEETAYFLHLAVKSNKPIIMTCAMRPATALSADGPKNIFDAAVVAANDQAIGKGVLIVSNGYIYSARDITKANTQSINAITGSEFGPLGIISDKTVHFYHQTTKKHTLETPFDVNQIKSLPNIGIAYMYADNPEYLIQSHLKNRVKGLIIAGLGDGNLTPNALKAFKKPIKNCIFVRSSRTGSGYIVPNAEINDSQYGFITANNLNPQKARVLLMLALIVTEDKNEIQNFFDQF